jgi:hypothetical protein
MKNIVGSAVSGHPAHFSRSAADKTDLAQFDVSVSRPSSARRLANFRTLVAEFAVRRMGYIAVAELLSCSTSAARNYIQELVDRGVVAKHPIDRKLYCGHSDPLIADEFLAALTRLEQSGPASVPTRRVHSLWDDAIVSRAGVHQPARRDPLVAALFGAAELPAGERS